MKPLVYVAGPYTNPDPVENTHKAVKIGNALYDTGLVAVIVPHLSLLAHAVEPRPYEYWLAFDLDQLAHCDAVYRFPGASSGADAEVRWALDHGVPVFHTTGALLHWAEFGSVPSDLS